MAKDRKPSAASVISVSTGEKAVKEKTSSTMACARKRPISALAGLWLAILPPPILPAAMAMP
ncbi:hypothetical protein D3C78_1871170 [compost metagenome]